MKEKKIFYGWYLVAGCFMILFAAFGIAYLTLGLYLTPICKTYNFTRGQFSITISLIGIFMGAGSIFCGNILKNHGFKATMAVGGTLISLGLLLMSAANELLYFYIAGSMIGIGNSLATIIPSTTIITNWFKKKRGFAMGMVLSATGIGGMIFSPIVAYIIEMHGYKTSLFLSAILVAVIVMPIVLFVIKETPGSIGSKPYGDKGLENNESIKSGFMFKEAKNTISFYLILISTLGFVVCLGGSLFFIPSLLTDTGINPIIVGTILSVLYSLNAVGKLLMGKINDKFGIKVCILFGAASFIVSMVISLYITTPFLGFVFAIIYGLSNPLATFPVTIMTSEIFGEKDYSSIISIMQAVASFGSGLAIPVIGIVYDNLGSYNSIFIILEILCIISLVISYLSFRFKPKFN